MSLTERIRDYVQEHQDDEQDITIAKLAEALGEEPQVVSFILDSFHVDQENEVKYVGTGAGGGWVTAPAPTPEEVLQRQLDDNVISEAEFEQRMLALQAGEDPRRPELRENG